MADVKKVLVVDDHFEMLELLRTLLELSNEECEVLAVPSAEEGLLELRRTHFDLVITDVRLPGMSGFDLVRRIKKLEQDVPVIMITAYSSSEGQKEAHSLGVLRYFSKPLDTDAVLMAVHHALHGEELAPAKIAAVYEAESSSGVSTAVRKRLQTLRGDTGATGLLLASLDGQILFEAANNRRLDFSKLAGALGRTIQQSFALSAHLDGEVPHTIQYYAGETIELYCASVGREHFLAIFFDVELRRGRIGTIWVFTQRAIKDLVELLATGPATPAEVPPTKIAPRPSAKPPRPVVSAPRPSEKLAEPQPALVQNDDIVAMMKAMLAAQEQEEEAETAVSEGHLEIDTAELEDLFGEDLPLDDENADLDAFWDDALGD
ncbi:MAG: response regulator [Ardenticatenaceae bacterium]|nr:response regulator [Ardenticatenaceae bacterium]MCB8986856.1 response regulator [Ardenticatenaceae bacterium]